MKLALMLILFGASSILGQPLKISIPYKVPIGNSIEDEMIVSPPPNPGNIGALNPVFGENRHADIYLEGIRINDPSAPRSTPNFNYINQDSSARIFNNTFELSSSKTALSGYFGNLGEKINLSIPHFNFSQNIYNFENKTSIHTLNASLKHSFKLNSDTKVETRVLKIKGESKYTLFNSLFTSKSDQTGFLLKTISSDKLIIGLSHFNIETDFGNKKIHGTTSELQIIYAFSPQTQFGLKTLHEHESNANESRFIPDLFFKNNTFKIGMKFLDKDIYPHATTQMQMALSENFKVGIEGLAQKHPPKLSELTTFYSNDGINYLFIRSKLTSETLMGIKGFLKYDAFKIDIGTDYLQNAIIFDYDQIKYINANPWGKPFIKLQTDFKVINIGYKYTSRSFTSNPFEMINIPGHHWNVKLDFSNAQFLFKVNFDILQDIKRYNAENKKIQKNGHEKRLKIKLGYFTKEILTPFIEYNIIKSDNAMPYAQDHIFWVGIEIAKI